MNFQRIEREIACLENVEGIPLSEQPTDEDAAQSLCLLLDVARAADVVSLRNETGGTPGLLEVRDALTALKEHCDESS